MIGRTNINGVGDASGIGGLISITAPTGSLVTVSNNGLSITLKSYIEIDDYYSQCFYLVRPNKFGTWTVSATDGTNTDTQTVLINTIGQFEEIALRYEFWLYKDGNFYSGLGAFVGTSDAGQVGMTSFNQDGQIYMKKISGPCARWYFRDPIPFRNLSNIYGKYLHFNLKQVTGSSAGHNAYDSEITAGVYSSTSAFGSNYASANSNCPAYLTVPRYTAINDYTEYTVAINNLTANTNYYLGMWTINCETYIKEIWIK